MTITKFLEKYGNHKFFDNSSFSLVGIEIHDEGNDSFFRGMATSGSDTVYFNFKLSESDSENSASLSRAFSAVCTKLNAEFDLEETLFK